MISKIPEKMHESMAYMKFRLDAAARLEYAHEEGFQLGLKLGFEQGFKQGKLVGEIEIFQLRLGLQQPTLEELLSCELSKLTGMRRRLRTKLLSRQVGESIAD